MAGAGLCGNSVRSICWSFQFSGAGHFHAGRLRGRQVLMDGALRDGATAGDLVLAQSEGMEPQNFLQLAHRQPLLWQLGVSTYQWSLIATAALRAIPIQCRSAFRTTAVKTDRLQFGTLIGITSES